MADKTKIEWTDATWNPITGCSVVSPGCTNCYAMKLAGTRLKNHPTRLGLTADSKAGPVWNGQVRFNESMLLDPLRWKRPRMIFVCAHGDLFAENVPDEWIDQVFAVMALAPHHTFQVLTKRPERMRAYLTPAAGDARQDVRNHLAWDVTAKVMNLWYREWKSEGIGGPHRSRGIAAFTVWPLPNVWLGVSVEDQKRADERIPVLLETPAAIRWISAEPLLGMLDVRRHIEMAHLDSELGLSNPCIDWVVAGGESGAGARPMHPDWARSLRDQCAAADVPFLFKQWGNWLGGTWEDIGDQGRFIPASGPDAAPIPYLARDGYEHWFNAATWPEGPGAVRMEKKYAGRMLDGVEHNGFPEVRS